MKLEIAGSKVKNTNIQIKYSIIVSNTGEVEGTSKVVDKIPTGFKISSENPTYWKEEKEGEISTTVELKAKETKELEVALIWKNKRENYGSMINKAEITDTKNPANYLETTLEDNSSEATIVIGVLTGKKEKILVTALGSIAVGGILILLYQYERYHKERNKEIRHILLEGKNVIIRKKKQK